MMIKSDNYLAHNGNKLDVLKLVLAVLIVGIHSSTPGMVLRPVLRLAVPLFFIISAYLFFGKQRALPSRSARKRGLLKYGKRILLLYSFWFVLLLPFTADLRQWDVDFGFGTVIEILRCFLFSSTFIASWFLMASLLGVALVWLLASLKVKDRWILVIGSILYAACCLCSSYYGVFSRFPGVVNAYEAYTAIFSSPFNSFPCAVLFVAIGKILAERSLWVSNKMLIASLAVSLVMLYAEFFYTGGCLKVVSDDCYFMLPVVSTCIFMLIGQSKPCHFDLDTKKLRAASTIIYCSHGTLLWWLHKRLVAMGIDAGASMSLLFMFTMTLFITLVLSHIILTLEKRQGLRWLKYSH